MMPYRALSNNQ